MRKERISKDWTSISAAPKVRDALNNGAAFMGISASLLLQIMLQHFGFMEQESGWNLLEDWSEEKKQAFKKFVESRIKKEEK